MTETSIPQAPELTPEQEAIFATNAREVLALMRPAFHDLPPDEQACAVADFVAERRAEFAASPELRSWLNASKNLGRTSNA